MKNRLWSNWSWTPGAALFVALLVLACPIAASALDHDSIPTKVVAPEPAALSLSGVGLAGVGWWVNKARTRRRFKAYRPSADGETLVLVEPGGASVLAALQEALYLSAKRGMDIVVAALALIVLSPLLVVIGVAVYIDSPGPLFYRHTRLGQRRRLFGLIKFRSMCMNADQILKTVLEENEEMRKEFEELFKLKNDPRVTRVGAFLRKTSLDELPQLVNVLLGDLSLVGPRPIVESEVEKYWPFEDRLFSVRPGVTGLWQVSGRNDVSYDERVRLDMRYIAERSLWKDVTILCATVPALLSRDNGAY